MEMEDPEDCKSEHEKQMNGNVVPEESASVSDNAVETSSSESDQSDDEDNNWPKIFSMAKCGLNVRGEKQSDELRDSKRFTEDKGDPNESYVSNESDVFEECFSQLLETESDQMVTADEGPLDHNIEELKKILICPSVVPPVVETPKTTENESPGKNTTQNEQQEEDEIQKPFCKDVPLDADQTWDFSLQAFNKDYKSKVLWIEGSFYQKFVGKCLHEMHNVPCECEEKKKISVCRLCHAVFCSNKCFKRALKAQTGEEDEEETKEEAAEEQEEVNLTSEVPKKPNKVVNNNSEHNFKGPALHKPNSKGKCEQQNTFAKPGIADNTRRRRNLPNLEKNLNEMALSYAIPSIPQNSNDTYSRARPLPPSKMVLPPHNMWPTQVQNPRNTQPNVNKLPSAVGTMKSPQRQHEPNNYNMHTQSREMYSPTRSFSTSNPINHLSQLNEFTETNSLLVDVSPQNLTADDKEPFDQYKQSPNKEPVCKVYRNPGPPLHNEYEESKQFFNRRGHHSQKSPTQNFQQPRSQEEHFRNYPGSRNHQQRRNSTSPHNRQNDANPTEQFQPGPRQQEAPTTPPMPNYNPDSNRNLEEFGKPSLNSFSNHNYRGEIARPGYSDDFKTDSNSPQSRFSEREDFQNRRNFPHPQQTQAGRARGRPAPYSHNTRSNYGPNPAQGNSLYSDSSSSYGGKRVEHGKFNNKGGRREHFQSRGEPPRPNYVTPSRLPTQPTPYSNLGTGRNNVASEMLSNSTSMYTGRDSTPSNSTDYYSTRSSNSTDADGGNKRTWKFIGPLDLPFGVVMQVQYVGGNDFHDFSVMTSRNAEAFRKLQPDLQTCEKRKMRNFECGNLCIAKWRSNDSENLLEEWYRGKITKDLGTRVKIYFLDLGIEAVVNCEAIFELPKSLANERSLAYRVRSLNVKADNSDVEVSEQFNTLVRGRCVKIRITHKDTTELHRFGCHLDVEHINKWFDAGILLKKLQVGDQATQEDILHEEQQNLIIPCARNALPDNLMGVFEPGDRIQPAKIMQVVGNNEFYVVTFNSVRLKNDLKEALVKVKPDPVKYLKDLSHPLFMLVDENNLRERVKILEVCDGSEVLVQKVDHGEILRVKREELNKLPEQFCTPSAFAFKCSLPVRPKTRSKGVPSMFQRVKETLEKALNETLYIKVFALDQAKTHIIEIYVMGVKTGMANSCVKKEWAEYLPGFDDAKIELKTHELH